MYRERKYAYLKTDARAIRKTDIFYDLKVITIPLLILVITLSIGDWLTSEERMVTLLTIFPLSGVIILEKLGQLFLSVRYAKVSWMILFAFVLMGQKADNPGGYPKSYTAVDLSTAFGNFNMNHLFNERYYGDCNNGEWRGETVEFQHQYAVGGIGVSRKINYNHWQSMLLSLNMYAGQEKENPVNNSNSTITAVSYDNTIWSISPKFQYDAKDVGFGLGGSFGKVGYDRDDADNHSDYNPEYDGRKFIMQARLRLGSENNFFVEGLGGYDADGVGEYTWQALGGSRFNTQKYMLKAGLAFRKKRSLGFTVSGEMLLADRIMLCPQFIYYYKNNNNNDFAGGGYRAVIGLQYRIYD
jgi:hypothetical protein